MATAVFVHAHPDDEAIATSGTMMQGVEQGHRVILVCATDGAMGEPSPQTDLSGTSLAEVRLAELQAAAQIIGVHRVEYLGYRDSGMAGDRANDDPGSFWQADVGEAARRLAGILDEESADLLTIYDEIGGYGHPDHLQVHRVGELAAELAGTPLVFESTMHRETMRSAFAEIEAMAAAQSPSGGAPEAGDDSDGSSGALEAGEQTTGPQAADAEQAAAAELDHEMFGTPGAAITHAVDVTPWIERKRAAMAAHASQIGEDSVFLAMPPEMFRRVFGTEWYVLRQATHSGEPYATDIYAAIGDPASRAG